MKVGLVETNTVIDPALAQNIYDGQMPGFRSDGIDHSFSDQGADWELLVSSIRL